MGRYEDSVPLIESTDTSSPPPARSKWRFVAWIIPAYCALLLIQFFTNVYHTLHTLERVTDREATEPVDRQVLFDWTNLPAKEDLEYVPCYEIFQCARLKLPLDWHKPEEGDIGVAIIKLKAPVPLNDSRHGGEILFNPGGPGGSGVIFVRGAGQELQMLTSTVGDGANDSKYFDIIGFDPRGVFLTTPMASCFENNATRHSFLLRAADQGVFGSSDIALSQTWALLQAQGAGCKPHTSHSIKKHTTTPAVARDMLAIIDKEAEWRANQLGSDISGAANSENLKRSVSKPKLKFWGFSYGTLLGATFASLYPDRVGRLVLDGVVEFSDYYDASWSGNLVDTEKVMDAFYEGCASAGPERCFFGKKNSTAQDIRTSVESILSTLRESPIAVPSGREPSIVTYSDLRVLITTALYSPALTFPYLGSIFSDLERGDGSKFAANLRRSPSYSCATPFAAIVADGGVESTQNIICSDGADIRNETVEDAYANWQRLEKVSPTIACVWAGLRMLCNNYKSRPAWRFQPEEYGAANGTAHPILWVGNTADPVTPLVNAHSQAKWFPGSRVLTNDGPGHCSISALSLCTMGHIQRYFYDGSLPDKGTVCVADQKPFDSGPDVMNRASQRNRDEVARSILYADVLSAALRSAGAGFGERLILPHNIRTLVSTGPARELYRKQMGIENQRLARKFW